MFTTVMIHYSKLTCHLSNFIENSSVFNCLFITLLLPALLNSLTLQMRILNGPIANIDIEYLISFAWFRGPRFTTG